MAYTKPTLSQIFDDVKNDMLSRFPDLDPSLTNGMWSALSGVIAGGVSGSYDYLDFILNQVFPDNASAEYLERWANIYGLSRLSATAAQGSVTFTGTIGQSVPTGAEMVSPAGLVYSVDTGFTLAAASEDHAVTAVSLAATTNQVSGAILTLSNSYAGIDPTVTVTSAGLTGGRDRETDDDLRTRVLARFALAPKGGSAADYDLWAREAVAATRTFVRNWENAALYGDSVAVGQVLLYFAMDNTYSDGIPLAGDVTDVQTYIDAVKPVGCQFTAGTLTAFTVNFDVTIVPDTASLRASVEVALEDAVTEFGIPGGEIEQSSFFEALSGVSGLTDWTLNSPIGSVTAPQAQLHTIGTVTFT